MNITRKDIIESIQDELIERNIKLDSNKIQDAIELIMQEIINSLAKGDNVELRNFGIFKSYKRKGRIGHNPKTKIKVKVPPKRIVSFLPGKLMKDEIVKYDHLFIK